MTTMVTELYDALRDAGASDEKARKGAEVVADYDDRFNRLERQIERLAGGMPVARSRQVMTNSTSSLRAVHPMARAEPAMDGLIRDMRIMKWMMAANLVLTYLIFLRSFGIIQPIRVETA